MTETRYATLARECIAGAVVMGRGEDFMLCHLWQGSVQGADAFAASLKNLRLCGLIAVTDAGVQIEAEPDPESQALMCRALLHFAEGRARQKQADPALFELDALYRLEDPRP